jgi:hypothetical protein
VAPLLLAFAVVKELAVMPAATWWPRLVGSNGRACLLNDAVLASVMEICGSPNETQMVRVMNIFYDVVVPYITTPRHVTRFQNAISVTWPAVRNEVNLADFIALETLRLYEPGLFKAIRLRRSEVCGGDRKVTQINNRTSRFDVFLQTCRKVVISWQNSPCSGFSRGWRRPAIWAIGCHVGVQSAVSASKCTSIPISARR